MKRITVLFLIVSFIICSVFLHSCTKQNEEDILMDYIYCSDSIVSYQNNISPILNRDCVPCHNSTSAEANVALDTYERVQFFAASGALLAVVKHESGFTPMPQGEPQWNWCKINTLQKWIEQGMLNN